MAGRPKKSETAEKTTVPEILLLYGIHFQKVLLSRTACIMRQKSLAESLCMRYNLSMLKDRR